ncbi:MAG: hypothetical protein WBP08_11880 [Saprospiraceae bacterium]
MKYSYLLLASLLLSFFSCSTDLTKTDDTNYLNTETRAMTDDSCGYAGLIQKVITTCEALNRYYYIQLPDDYNPAQSYPLLLVFHGKGSGTKNKACAWKERIGDWINENKYIAVYGRSYKDLHWYVEGACLPVVDEVCYIEKIISEMKTDYNIYENRIYAMGTSNGGGLCYSLISQMDDFAAIATFAAYKWGDYSFTEVPKISLMQVHGTEDGTIPYGGGTLFCLNFENAYTSCAEWAEHNNCTVPVSGESTVVAGNEINIATWCSKKISPLDPAICKKCKKEVIHYKLNGIGHTIYEQISEYPEYKEYINDQLFSFFKRNRL